MRRDLEDLSITGCCSEVCCWTPSMKPVGGEKRPRLREGALARSSCYWRRPTGGREGRRGGLMDLDGAAGGKERESGGTPGNGRGGGDYEGKRHGAQLVLKQRNRPWRDGPHQVLTGAPHGRARHCHSISARSSRSTSTTTSLVFVHRLPPPDHLAAFVNVHPSSYIREHPQLSQVRLLQGSKRQSCSSFPTATIPCQRSQPVFHVESIESGLSIFLYLRLLPHYSRRRMAS